MGKTLSKGYITFSRKRTPKTAEHEEAPKPIIRSLPVHAETLSTDFDLAGKPYTTNQYCQPISQCEPLFTEGKDTISLNPSFGRTDDKDNFKT